MPTPISHRAAWDVPADTVHAVLVDRAYLEARLQELGGKDPALLAHEVGDDHARVQLRQAVPVEFLPSLVKSLTGGDLVLHRTETWRRRAGDGWEGDVEVTVQGLPGSITGTQELTGAGGGSETRIGGHASVPAPFVGGKIERTIVDQVAILLRTEDEFTRRWLAS